jgi:glycosyltransferase 2 family protein
MEEIEDERQSGAHEEKAIFASSRVDRLVESLERHQTLLRRLGVAASVAIIAVSLVVFFFVVISIDPRQFEAAIAGTGGDQIFSAFCLAALSYLALTGYDALALRHLHIRTPYRTTALASFASYAISFTLGFPLITGGAVRYWIYGPAGLSAGKVASLTLIAGVTFWLGMGLVVGLGLIAEAPAISEINHFNVLINQVFGVGVIAVLLGYLAFVSRRKVKPIVLHVRLPGPLVTLGQMALGVIDVCSAAGALYVLLPKSHGLAFVTFASLYSFACMLGIASHAPGGIGVFEATMLKTVPAEGGPVLASLLLFRAIYYLVPFILAMALLGAHEAGRRWRSLREAMEAPSNGDE